MINHIVLAFFAVLAVIQDIYSRKIKNIFNLLAAIVSLIVVIIFREIGIMEALLGFVSSFAIGILLWRMGAIRAGDAKFLWTVGVLKGFKYFWISMIYIILAGGIISLGIILLKKDFKERMLRLWNYVKLMFMTKKAERYKAKAPEEFPFTIPIAIGCFLEYAVRILG